MSDWKKHEEHDTIVTALLDGLGKEYYCFDCDHFFIYEFTKEKGTESEGDDKSFKFRQIDGIDPIIIDVKEGEDEEEWVSKMKCVLNVGTKKYTFRMMVKHYDVTNVDMNGWHIG